MKNILIALTLIYSYTIEIAHAGRVDFYGKITIPSCQNYYGSHGVYLSCKENEATNDSISFSYQNVNNLSFKGVNIRINDVGSTRKIVTVNYI